MDRPEEKQALQDLKAAIRNKEPANLYIFYGEETFLLNHYLTQLKKVVLDELTESFNYHRFNSENFDLRAFVDAVENLPMMAERTLVQLDDVDIFKLPEEGRDTVAAILSDIPEYCTLVLTYETVEFKLDKRYKKLYEAVDAGQLVEFPKQSQRDLINWIQRHFIARKKQIAPELCAYLIDITDGTMTSLGSEIEKIVAYSGADHICRADIDAVTEPVMDAVIYQLTDRLGIGDYSGALQTLQVLLKMQEDPIKILGSIGSHFRRLSAARILQEYGKTYSDLRRLAGYSSDYPAKKAMEAARRFKPEFCARASELILETDHKMKTSFDDQERLLELLILQLAQEAKHG